MEDYRMFDGLIWHDSTSNTKHPKYDFKLSAKDIARFGLLYLNQGKWNDSQIISKEWIEKSYTPYSTTNDGGYGYLWWIEKINDSLTSYSARGWGGHVISVIPELELVFVMRNDTYNGKGGEWFDKELIQLIANAKISKEKLNPNLIPLKILNDLDNFIEIKESELLNYEQNINVDGKTKTIVYTKFGLLYDDWHKLMPITKTKFFIEDLNEYIYFKSQNNKFVFDRIEQNNH